jgi:hypothetical protein
MKKLLIMVMVMGGCESKKDKIIKAQQRLIEMQAAYYDSLQMDYDSLYKRSVKMYRIARWATDSLIIQKQNTIK